MNDERLVKTYVWHGDQCYFVSTIMRDSSAAIEAPTPRYGETIAWKFDWDTGQRGKSIGEHGHGRLKYQIITGHCFIVERIADTGEFPELEMGE